MYIYIYIVLVIYHIYIYIYAFVTGLRGDFIYLVVFAVRKIWAAASLTGASESFARTRAFGTNRGIVA